MNSGIFRTVLKNRGTRVLYLIYYVGSSLWLTRKVREFEHKKRLKYIYAIHLLLLLVIGVSVN